MNNKALKEHIKFFTDSTLNSYSEVFFAKNRVFSVLLIGITFFDPFVGLCGIISVIATNYFAYILGFAKESIAAGSYGFNSMLVGLGLGFYYGPNVPFFVLLIVGALATLLATVTVAGVLQKYNLPYLSVPFLLSLWAVMLASRNFEALEISERGIYKLNELYATGSGVLVSMYRGLKELPIPELLKIYFNSLGAILFQFNMAAGIIIAIGLLIYSRIAFTVSLISFISAYYFYQLLGADIRTLSYSYIGFNFILSGIAIGSYFLVPSRSSILWALLLVPGLMVLTSSLGSLFQGLQLSIYSLPFNIVVLSFLYVLKLRDKPGQPEEVFIQHHVPEHNLYNWLSNKTRFNNFKTVAISAPVFGNWAISQGHDGEITHRGEWKEAWDFVILGDDDKQFKDEGNLVEDYYCYDKPIVAPADGVVEEIVNDIDDNFIGDSNLKQNWGNSIIIKHDHQLYTQISHIKKDTIKVKKGESVSKGDVIAHCGNSGRSPYPHLHFQIQSTPCIGSKTLEYPLSHYLTHNDTDTRYCFFDFPKEGQTIQNIEVQSSLYWAFHFLPGQIIKFRIGEDSNTREESWEVKTDFYNNTYLQDLNSDAKAYFNNDGNLFYFEYFSGSRKTLLYEFFLGTFKVLLSVQKGLEIHDEIPLHLYTRTLIRRLHDFIAPIKSFIYAKYRLSYGEVKKSIGEEKIILKSRTWITGLGISKQERQFTFEIEDYKIKKFIIKNKDKEVVARWVS